MRRLKAKKKREAIDKYPERFQHIDDFLGLVCTNDNVVLASTLYNIISAAYYILFYFGVPILI